MQKIALEGDHDLPEKKQSILAALRKNPDATDTRVSELATELLPADKTVSRGYVSKIKSEEPELVAEYVPSETLDAESEDNDSVGSKGEKGPVGDESVAIEEPFSSLSDKQQAIVDTIARHRLESDSQVKQQASELLPGETTVSRAYVAMARDDFPGLIAHRDEQIEADPEGTTLRFEETDSTDESPSESSEGSAETQSGSQEYRLTSKSDYHELTDKMRAIVDAIAEDPDASDTRIAEIATEKLPVDSTVSRAYVPKVRASQESVINSRIETQANKRDFNGESTTTGDPFADAGLSASPAQQSLSGSAGSDEDEDEDEDESASSTSGNSVDQLAGLESDSDSYQMISERPVQETQSDDDPTGSSQDESTGTSDQESVTAEMDSQSADPADTPSRQPAADVAPTERDPASESQAVAESSSQTATQAVADDETVSIQVQLQRGDVESLLFGSVPDTVRKDLLQQLVTKAFD